MDERDPQVPRTRGESDRHRRLEHLFDLHGDAVFRSAAFAGSPDSAEQVTVEIFRDLWLSSDDLDHTDGGARLRLVMDSVSRACRPALPTADAADRSSDLMALALVLFAECTYRQVAAAMAVPEVEVLRRLDSMMLRLGGDLERSTD